MDKKCINHFLKILYNVFKIKIYVMKRILLTLMAMIVFSACSAEVMPTVMPEATADIEATVEARVAEERIQESIISTRVAEELEKSQWKKEQA